MSSDVDAVIAALRVVLHEAETRTDLYWKTHIVNKWIDQLPGVRWGKLRELRLRSDSYGDSAVRLNLITHVRATLAYLEANREAIAVKRSWWPFRVRAMRPAPEAPAVVAKERLIPPEKPREVSQAPDPSTKPKWLH